MAGAANRPVDRTATDASPVTFVPPSHLESPRVSTLALLPAPPHLLRLQPVCQQCVATPFKSSRDILPLSECQSHTNVGCPHLRFYSSNHESPLPDHLVWLLPARRQKRSREDERLRGHLVGLGTPGRAITRQVGEGRNCDSIE